MSTLSSDIQLNNSTSPALVRFLELIAQLKIYKMSVSHQRDQMDQQKAYFIEHAHKVEHQVIL